MSSGPLGQPSLVSDDKSSSEDEVEVITLPDGKRVYMCGNCNELHSYSTDDSSDSDSDVVPPPNVTSVDANTLAPPAPSQMQ